MKKTRKKSKGPLLRIRVPFCSRPGKVIIAAKGKGSYRHAKKEDIVQEWIEEC